VTDVRVVFLEVAGAVTPLLRSPALAARWGQESALPRFRVSGLAGHLVRSAILVNDYLDRPEPLAGSTLSAPAYYAAAIDDTDIDGALHTGIRARGEETAAGGPGALFAAWEAATDHLRGRLGGEPPLRRVQVFKDIALSLDDWLRTRLVELCVHADDLAASLGLPPPDLPVAATALAIETLVDLARLRHGDPAVLRALTRRERDDQECLRVL
jgi:hypothetical protein